MQLAQRMNLLGTETAFEVLAKAKALEAQGKSVIHLHIGAPDFRTPENVVEAGRKALKDGYHAYTPAKGLPELREAVCEDIEKRRGAKVHPDRVLIVPGGKPTMAYAISMFGEPGAEIIHPNPGFPIYESMIRWSGAEPVAMPLEEAKGFSFSAEQVLARITPRLTGVRIDRMPCVWLLWNHTAVVLERWTIGMLRHRRVGLPARRHKNAPSTIETCRTTNRG